MSRPWSEATAFMEKRACPRCGHLMSDYATDVCFRCQTKAEAAMREREFAQAAIKYPNGVEPKKQPTKGVRMAGGIKLVPEALPQRQVTDKGSRWPLVIAEFVESGVECARVEDSDHKNASSTYAQLREHLNGEKRCYPAVRQGHCYLVRVKSRKTE